MPKWELDPFSNFPQTPELLLDQIEQELESLELKKVWLLSEKARLEAEVQDEA